MTVALFSTWKAGLLERGPAKQIQIQIQIQNISTKYKHSVPGGWGGTAPSIISLPLRGRRCIRSSDKLKVLHTYIRPRSSTLSRDRGVHNVHKAKYRPTPTAETRVGCVGVYVYVYVVLHKYTRLSIFCIVLYCILHCPQDRGVHNVHRAKHRPTPTAGVPHCYIFLTRAGRRLRTRTSSVSCSSTRIQCRPLRSSGSGSRSLSHARSAR